MVVKKINDTELQKSLSEIIYQLAEKELASKITIMLKDDVGYIGAFGVSFKAREGIIIINIKAKKMLQSKKDRHIVYAVLSHEIGHIKHCLENEELYLKLKKGKDSFVEIGVGEELAADKEALVFLKKIYQEPKKILLRQIKFAVNAVMQCDYATEEDRKTTRILAKKRREALLPY